MGYIPEYIKSINDLQTLDNVNVKMFTTSLVTDPVPLHPASLPKHVKDMYKEKLYNFDKSNHLIRNSETLIQSGLHLLNGEYQPERTPENFYKFVNEYDRVLNTDYRLVYPELN